MKTKGREGPRKTPEFSSSVQPNTKIYSRVRLIFDNKKSRSFPELSGTIVYNKGLEYKENKAKIERTKQNPSSQSFEKLGQLKIPQHLK